MKKKKQNAGRYTIEREFLEHITVTELIGHIIYTYLKKCEEQEAAAP